MTNPPGRGLEYAKPLPPDEHGRARIQMLCDCATTTILHVEIERPPHSHGHLGWSEQAFTCDGCGTAHWFTVTINPEDT